MRWVSDGSESPEFPTDSTGRRYFGNSFLVAPPSPYLDFIVDQRLTRSKSPPYLEYLAVLNTSHHGDKASFTLFPVLPPELRVKVWRMSMENRYRLLNIHIMVCDRYINSKLLYVNSESRAEALRFYRVHIPASLMRVDLEPEAYESGLGTQLEPKYSEGILYFNLENDFVKIGGGMGTLDFIHDLKAYDPKDVGLLRAVLNQQSSLFNVKPSIRNIPESPARASWLHFLSTVEDVIWTFETKISKYYDIDFRTSAITWFPFRALSGFSLPLQAATPFFELLDHDPRPVRSDLMLAVCAPRVPNVDKWPDLLAQWGVVRRQPVRQRVLVRTIRNTVQKFSVRRN